MTRPSLAIAMVFAVACSPPATERVVELPDAMGLHAGDPVRSAGVDVGRVREVTLHGGSAWVAFTVRSDVDLVVDGTCGAVEARGLVGEAMLTLAPIETEGEILEPGTVPACELMPALADATGPLVAAAGSLADFLEQAAHGRGILGRLANDAELADALEAYLARADPGATPVPTPGAAAP